jgi:hypothetical protein
MKVKHIARPREQARLPLRGYTLCDSHPRAEAFRQFALLGEREETTLTRLEADEYETDEELEADERALDNITQVALTYWGEHVAPVVKDWWL